MNLILPPETKQQIPIPSIYGDEVFSIKTMRDYLPEEAYGKLCTTIRKADTLDPSIADAVADAMKVWALEKGASHYTHWFQPLTGSTAEKHDSFIEPDGEGGILMEFSGEALIRGEPDASSFPSGGLRATFEARGYTTWDPTSPVFIKRSRKGATLCIPTAFCSYTGEALDKKTPLLRSIQAISMQARRILACFGEIPKERVMVTLGPEQEYFLIDKEVFLARPDLIQTGRTLFGTIPPKHQQLDDHYYGAIKERVIDFMIEVDRCLWKLGIPATTRHNEVSPAQFEIATMYEDANLAVDHNMMTMETLRRIADRHGFVCLMHEKPFAGVNGSGKHNNWSLAVEGRNLLEPGVSPQENAIFLTFLCAVIEAVDSHADLLRAAVATAGNDHRLGGSEAPPTIVSVFLGEPLMEVLEQMGGNGTRSSKGSGHLKIGVDALPVLPRDATDRNRTSPFAFTGDKFEFRAVGANQSCAGACIVLNTIVAESLERIASILEKVSEERFEETLQSILKKCVKEHKRIIFNGDNYTEEWSREARRRGLSDLRSTPEALNVMISDEARDVFSRFGVLSEAELHSRYEVYSQEYEMKVGIEAKLSLEIARTMILPVALRQQGSLARDIAALEKIGAKASVKEQRSTLEHLGVVIEDLYRGNSDLQKAIASGSSESSIEKMQVVRRSVDSLEGVIDASLWPLPKYAKMLFIN